MSDHIIVTGADGCVGTALVSVLARHGVRTTALVHAHDADDLQRRREHLTRFAGTPVDCQPLEMTGDEVELVDAAGATVVHGAGITNFKVREERARQVNVEGARKVFDAAARAGASRVIALGSLYCTGLQPGLVPEGPIAESDVYANHYERSKWELEQLLVGYGDRFETTMLRPATVVTDGFPDAPLGQASFANAVHHTLALGHRGLLPLVPADPATPLFMVTAEATAQAIFSAATGPHVGWANISGTAAQSATFGDLISCAFAAFEEDPQWRRRRTPEPMMADLETFIKFADGVTPFADPMVSGALRSMRPFAPQLYIRKEVENTVGSELAHGDVGFAGDDVTDLARWAVVHGFPTNQPKR